MKKVAGALALLLAGLACTACGSASKSAGATTATTTRDARATEIVWLPATQRVTQASGAGSKTIGTVTFRGDPSITVSCTGKGNLELSASPALPGLGATCPETGDGLGPTPAQLAALTKPPLEPRSGHGDRRARIRVDAPARVHWTVTVQETYGKPSTVPAGLQQLPLRRSGVGPESLGTFAMTPGWLYVAGTCVGKGTFGVWWNKDGSSGACLNSRTKASVKVASNFPASERRARIDIRVPVGMKWTIVIFEGPRPSGPHDPTNVWP